ncbi:MAG: hypothetical protein HC898_03395 [Phycisphaerales bacterium]|nr:hypothetical protein [Phycisphaerales bacterium]
MIRSRPSLDQPLQISRYSAQGRLLEREMGEGRKLVPADKSEVVTTFKLGEEISKLK